MSEAIYRHTLLWKIIRSLNNDKSRQEIELRAECEML